MVGMYGYATSALTSNILLNDSTIKHIHIFLPHAQVTTQDALYGLVDVAVDLRTLALLLQPQQVQHVVPLALLLDHVNVVVDQLQELILQDLPIFPLEVDDGPDVLLLYLVDLELLESVVELFYPAELDVAALPELADLTTTLHVEFYTESLLALGRLDVGYKVDRQRHVLFYGSKGTDHQTAIDVYGGAVGNTLVLEVKHLLPYSIAVLSLALIQRFLLEDAALHLIEEFLLGQRTGQLTVVLVVDLPFVESRVALAGQVVDALLEQLIVQVVILYLLQEYYERFFEFCPRFLDVDERLADEEDFILGYCLLRVVLELILGPHLLYLFRTIFPLWRLLLDDVVPIEYSALVGQVLRVLEIQAFEIRFADQPVDFGQKGDYLGVSLQLQEAIDFAIVAFVIGGVCQHCQISIECARVEKPQFEQTGSGIAVQNGPIFGTRPQNMRKCLFVLQNGLDVLLVLEEDIGLLPQLVTSRRHSLQGLAADDGDVVGEEEELGDVLVVALPAEGVGDAYLHVWHETLLQDGCLSVVRVDCHQDCKSVLLEGLARSGQHVGTVLESNDPDDAEADVDQRVYAVLQLCQTSHLAFAGLEGNCGEFVRVEVQVLSLEGECFKVVDCLEVVIAEGAQWLFLHLPTKLIIDCHHPHSIQTKERTIRPYLLRLEKTPNIMIYIKPFYHCVLLKFY